MWTSTGTRSVPATFENRRTIGNLCLQEVLMDLKLDDGLKTLIESGKEKGFLTYDQVNEYLPDDAVNPEKLDQLLLLLEEQGIELVDEMEGGQRESSPAPRAAGNASAEPDVDVREDLGFIEEEVS